MTVLENGTVLVPVSEYGEFNFLVTLCRKVESHLKLHPVFIFSPEYGMVHTHGQLLESENWSWAQLGSDMFSYRSELDVRSDNGYFRVFSESALDIDNKQKLSKRNLSFVPLCIAVSFFQFLARIKKVSLLAIRKVLNRSLKTDIPKVHIKSPASGLKSQLKHAHRLFEILRPKLILSGQDFALSVTSIISIVGEQHGVKTAIVPFNMPPTTREILESFAYHGYNRLHGLEKHLAQVVNPKWLNIRRGQVYSRINILAALAADSLDLMPPEPWLPNSGRGIVCVPSRWAYDYYSKAGIPLSQLILTGATWSDTLVQSANTRAERRRRLLASMKCTGERIMIISWPPNQYPRKARGCSSYKDLCNQFIQVIEEIQFSKFARVAVSLHPTLTDAVLLEKIQSVGIHVLRSSLINVVDCADIFVSTVSSTNFWALQCGIPTINFDGYLYGYTEFDEAGAITIKTPAELFTVCKSLFENHEKLIQLRNRIEQQSAYFTEQTGQNTSRILYKLAELAN